MAEKAPAACMAASKALGVVVPSLHGFLFPLYNICPENSTFQNSNPEVNFHPQPQNPQTPNPKP